MASIAPSTRFISSAEPYRMNGDTNEYDIEMFDDEASNTESGPSVASSGALDGHNDTTVTPNSEPAMEQHLPPIAIVGIGLRLPGNVSTTEEFWDLLVNKRSTRCRVPESRFNVDAFYSDSGKPGTVNSKYGHYLDIDIDRMDASFFSMSKAEVEKLDPQQRLLLEVVWECMENGGQKNWRGGNIGCYVGVYGDDWLDLSAKDPQRLGMYRITSSAEFGVANRLSYEFDLKGPSMTIRTACSSSLVGLHEACQAIYSGSCDSAVVAGANVIVSPTLAVTLTEQGVISPSGVCQSFDKKADGYVRAEAVNAVYVKKLSDALRDGDPIRGVIRATGSNFDGKTSGITNPSKESQENLIRRTYRAANISNPGNTGFVECHGTGTAVGDPLETSAVGKVFGGQGEVLITSVKPNVGHSEGASGLTSLIKAVLALEKEVVPPNINFSDPNPKIGWQEFGLRVPTEALPWPENRAARVSVNNFGIGGANAHVIIDSPKPFQKNISKVEAYGQHLLLFSAHDPGSLNNMVSQVKEYASKHQDRLADISFTLGVRREQLAHRTFAIADRTGLFQASPVVQCTDKSPRRVNFVFTGQGAQWASMAVELLDEFPSFLSDIRHMDRTLKALHHAPIWSMEEELLRPLKQSRIDQPEFAQPICTAVQIGIIRLLRSWNVLPAAVVGHSSGEIAAAFAAGLLTLEASIAVAYYRGQVTRQQLRSGAMAAVGLGPSDVKQYLEAGVVVACENSATSTTISGDSDALDSVLEKIKVERPECFVRKLKVDKAYHSHHMQEVGDLYQKLLHDFIPGSMFPDDEEDGEKETSVVLFSSVTGKQATRAQMGPAYWRMNLESPVVFSSAVQAMLASTTEESLCLEIGPHSALSAPLRDIIKSANLQNSVAYVPTLLRNQNSTQSLLSCLGQLFQHSVNIDIPTKSDYRVLTDLPNYSWRREEAYWNESRVSREWRLRKFPPHELLGIRTLEASDTRPTWRNILKLNDVPWLPDHRIKDDIVLPAAAYLAMAGEAVRQVADGPVVDFYLRQVNIKAALVLREAEGAELMTYLAPMRLVSSLDSSWYEFSIVSHNGSGWVEHCNGQVRAGKGVPIPCHEKDFAKYPRISSATALYKSMRRVGLNYGPRFQGMEDISAEPGSGRVSASISDHHDSNESSYQLHPSTIDFCLQLQIVAAAEGLPYRINNICMPTYIEEMYVGQASSEMRVAGQANSSSRGTIRGSATATSDDLLALSITNARFSVLDDSGVGQDKDTVAAAQLQWKPDVDFVSLSDLIRPRKCLREVLSKLERLTLLSMVKTLQLVEGIQITGHLYRFRYWLASQRTRAAQGEYRHVDDAEALACLTEPQLSAEIESATEDVRKTGGFEVAELILRAMSNAPNIFNGKVKPIEVLMANDGLGNIYRFIQSLCDGTPLYELLSHANPAMKVLEIGAGTGGTTAEILRGFTSDTGERMYAQYDFTDISTGFFAAAQERFKEHDGIECKVLDISKDPIAQGFEAESYDFIVASNVLHATPSIQATLRNVRKLIKPGGKLFLQELSPEWRMINYIMGFLSGWWLGVSDERLDEPYISPTRWDSELREAGFSGTDAVVYDDETPYQINANIISSTVISNISPGEVSILVESSNGPASLLQDALTKRGYNVSLSSLDELPDDDVDVISLLDLESPYFHDISDERLKKLQTYLATLPPDTSVLWVTGHSQVGCDDPRYAASIGAIRTIRSELSLDVATLELDVREDLDVGKVADVFHKIRRQSSVSSLDPDREFAVLGDKIIIPRYNWINVREQSADSKKEWVRKLETGRVGQIRSLRWVTKCPEALADHEIEIEPRAVGLNLKDILLSTGAIEATTSDLGQECAGIVRKIGSAVDDVKIGDRVMALHHGSFASRVVCSMNEVVAVPETLSFEEAATVPYVYSTAIYSLITVGGLERDQSVLIHSACGGVGIAAMHISKLIGAKIFATVGSPEKAQFLVKNFGIPQSHIFSSRDSSFYSGIMAATNGSGVDLVLNSLAGELLHLSWKCVAKFGKLLELGKQDFAGHGQLGMDNFEANRTFCGIDISQLALERPKVLKKLLERCTSLLDSGRIKPINPVTAFKATDIIESFKYLQAGSHIGKVAVSMPDKFSELPVAPVTSKAQFKPDASYLLVGGLGGLGRTISTWMVDNGARHIIYLSRSAGQSNRDKTFIHELESQGCAVQCVAGRVEDPEAVTRAVNNAAKPISGVLHMSLVLRDRNILNYSHEDWHAAVKPKVDGAWNLHHALANTKLDFFVLFSSISYVVGQSGQANYAAANGFLAAFAQYRHAQGLPASVMDIGMVEDAGYLSENAAILEQFKALNYHTLREADLLQALTYSISRQGLQPLSTSNGNWVNSAEIAVGLGSTKAFQDPSNRIPWRRDARMGVAHVKGSARAAQAEPESQGLAQFLGKLAADPSALDATESRDFLTARIGDTIYGMMMKNKDEVNVNLPLAALGVDSLVAIEIRDWWQRTFGLHVNVLEIMGASGIRMLGHMAVDGLKRVRLQRDGSGRS
ncbi:polyketide synthase [Colletotrichum truncatum]|uniref:Polyketide synthase n=1 Tax=Colletotrichum truncatum TaxID=5467 RepID=A0ACC3YYC3_COLTU|nr:polyketide synthase [Colletotrichum truncatum]KAF6782103.1 polyketide synthase [Colletotrichum truncatum]